MTNKEKKFGLWKVGVLEVPSTFEYFGTEEGLKNWFKFNNLTVQWHELDIDVHSLNK